MRRYHLGGPQFDSLARGFGDPTALAILVDSQLAKRRLLVVAVVRRVRALGGAVAGALDAPVELLGVVDRHAPAVAARVLGHPFLDTWASHLLRDLDLPGARRLLPRLGYLGMAAAAAAALAGIPFELTLATVDGMVVLPTLGTATGLGGAARVRGTGGRLMIQGPARTVTVPAPFQARAPGWRPLRSLDTSTAGLRLTVTIEDTDPHRDCYRWPPVPPLGPAGTATLHRLIEHAWQLLVREQPRHAPAMRAALRALVPVRAAPGQLRSAASQHAFGAVGVSVPPDPQALALVLLHEFQHMKLGALLDLVDLHHPGGPARYHAPWRPDPRPIGPFLQGVYAHLGVAQFWRARREFATGTGARHAHEQFSYWRAQLGGALAQLTAADELTSLGRAFVTGLHTTVTGWSP